MVVSQSPPKIASPHPRARIAASRFVLVGLVVLIVPVAFLQLWLATLYHHGLDLDELSSVKVLSPLLEKHGWKIQSANIIDKLTTTTNAKKDMPPAGGAHNSDPLMLMSKSSTTTTTTKTTNTAKVRFLFGIMSHDKRIEQRRRQNIRRTYLSFYGDFTSQTHRICALADIVAELKRLPADSAHQSPVLEECQILYTFVIGANPSGPTQLLEFNDTYPLTVDHSQIPNPEWDVVYLNIQENGKYGKSPTWFKYGVTLWQSHFPHLSLDYIVKTDSDTALYPHRFFEMVELRNLQAYPHNLLTYGGSPFDKYMCGYPQHDHCALLQTPTYMGGGFYFLSMDLADYITGPDCPRARLFFPHEDMTTGNYVYSHPHRDHITWIGERTGYETIWRHAVKNPNRLVHYYVKHLWQLQADGIVTAQQIQAWNHSFHGREKAHL